MHPWLVHNGAGWGIATYFFCIALGMSLGSFALRREALREGLAPKSLMDIALVVVPGAWIGSRLLYLLVEDPTFLWTAPQRLWSPGGGFVFLGGFAMVATLIILRTRRAGLPLPKVLDCFAPALGIGYAFGRLGCLGAGCCWGKPITFPFDVALPWGIAYHAPTSTPAHLHGVMLHPSPLYESLLGLALFAWVTLSRKQRQFDGEMALRFLGGYAVGRFCLEFLRGDPGRGFHGMFSTSQWLCMGMLATAAVIYAWRRHVAGALSPG